jgi:UDP-N-acetylmuramoyl-tripeptide--D-alanyl-D-alanine ligase
VPSVALAIEDEGCAVFELGMSVPGEIDALRRIVEPDVAALLNVGVAHASSFGGSRAEVAREKGALFEGLGRDGVAVVGIDDDAARGQLVRCSESKHVGFGTSPDADVRLVHREPIGTDAARVTLARATDSFDVYLPATGAAAALDLAAAVAIADATNGQPIPSSLIAASVRDWRPVTGRCVVTELAGEVLVIDDSYNANPGSMSAALATLMELRSNRSGRAIAVLGSMRELGAISAQAHVTLGHELSRRGVAIAVGCGGEIDATLRAAETDGVQVHSLGDAVEAGAWLVKEVRPGDVVLFKGSRAAGVERALAGLVAHRPAVVRTGSPRT